MSTTTLSTLCRNSCNCANCRPRIVTDWPSSALMLSTATTRQPGMRGASRWRAIVVLPTLPEKLMTASFMISPWLEAVDCWGDDVKNASAVSLPRTGLARLRAPTPEVAGASRTRLRSRGCGALGLLAAVRTGCDRGHPSGSLRHLAPNGAAAHVHACVGQGRTDRLERVALITKLKNLGSERSSLARDPSRRNRRGKLHVTGRARC